MKILVTGAAGFLGGHVARYLAMTGHEVVGLDRSDASDASYRIHKADFLDVDDLVGAMSGCDVVCHLGAIGDVYLAAEQPRLAARTNVEGCTAIAAAAARTGTRVVYASTWEVYGEPRYEPIDESHPCSPDHPYSITKLAGEQLLLAADELNGVPALALRLGTAYGNGLRSNSVFRVFIDRARRGERIVVQGDGSQGRQFTHAADIARAFELAATSTIHGVALNIVSDEFVSIKDLALEVAGTYPTEVIFGEPRPGDVPTAILTSSAAAASLGWVPEVAFTEGLSELLSEE